MTKEIIEVSIKQVELFSIIASSISIILGIIAIVLSILFYKMSENTSKENSKTSKNIDNNVHKLDILFDKLYTDTFDIMKNTVKDMSNYVYKNNSHTNDNKLSEKVKDNTLEEIKSKLEKINLNTLEKSDILGFVEEGINKSEELNNKFSRELLRDKIISYLRTFGEANFQQIEKYIDSSKLKKTDFLVNELNEMSKEHILNDPFDRNGENFNLSFSAIFYIWEK